MVFAVCCLTVVAFARCSLRGVRCSLCVGCMCCLLFGVCSACGVCWFYIVLHCVVSIVCCSLVDVC